MNTTTKLSLAAIAGLLVAASCESTPKVPPASPASLAAWSTIYAVLQHPRCMNCHPSDGVPKQGDDKRPHPQNVQGGADGQGRFALRCEACHRPFNLQGPHMPPGAPNWHMPSSGTPMIFEGKTSAQLCRQLKDLELNGKRTPEQIFEHISKDPLVLWGWSPGEGRTPVSISHEDFVRAVRAWIDGGCGCPE